MKCFLRILFENLITDTLYDQKLTNIFNFRSSVEYLDNRFIKLSGTLIKEKKCPYLFQRIIDQEVSHRNDNILNIKINICKHTATKKCSRRIGFVKHHIFL